MNPSLDFAAWQALQTLYADYAAVLDHGELQRWPDFFTDDAVYRLQSRENFDRRLPLATMAFESRGMLIDRVYGAVETIYHDPYSQRHIVGAPRVLGMDGDVIRSEANYLVVRTKRDALPEVLSVGRYLDRVLQTADGMKFVERLVIFDNDLIPNSIIAPI